MADAQDGQEAHVRYQPDEHPPHAMSASLGLQAALLTASGIVLTPAIVVRAAGQPDSYLTWAVFAALLISGIVTIVQASRLGRIGAGHILIMGTSGAFIAVCVTALAEGGPGMLATLIIISSVFQFVLAARLSILRRIITPVVPGTVIALIAVTVMPIMFDMLAQVPEGSPKSSGPVSAGVTLAVVAALALRSRGVLRLWAPIVGLAVGCLAAIPFGIYDLQLVADAPWFGLPDQHWMGLDLSYNAAFWALLPAFIFVTLVGAIETVGDAIAIQRVSWRKPRAIDFRRVQGAVAADGLGNLLSGIFATVPNTTYSSSVPLAEITGVAARNVGISIGIIFMALAFMPKVTAVFLAIPGPVVAAYLIVLIALLFMQGMKMVLQDGLDYRNAVIVGLSFWVGVGFQNEAIFADHLGETLGSLLGNGMTTGGLTAILLTLFMEITNPRRRRKQMVLDVHALPKIKDFLGDLAHKRKWGAAGKERLWAAAEETLLALLGDAAAPSATSTDWPDRWLVVTAQARGNALVVEFMVGPEEHNLEDRMAVLRDRSDEAPSGADLSLRLLQHFASTVRHQQFHDHDIVTIRVENPRDLAAARRS